MLKRFFGAAIAAALLAAASLSAADPAAAQIRDLSIVTQSTPAVNYSPAIGQFRSSDLVLRVADSGAPEAVAQATGETTKITWAWGEIVSQWIGAIGWALMALVAWGMRMLPGQVVAILVTMRADQLFQKAIDYGLNAVAGAAKGKVLTVDVGNAVLAEAAQYVLDNAPGWLVKWLGGPEQIVKKLFARLNLAPESTAPDAPAVVANVTA